MNLKEFYQNKRSLIDENLKSDLEFLILELLNIKKLDLFSNSLQIDEFHQKKIEEHIEQLRNGKPLAYILQSQKFLSHTFYVDERVLIPRPETEFMVDYCYKNISSQHKRVLDIGAGSGCIGISFLLDHPNSTCVFIEKSELARQVLKKNLESYSISNKRYLIFDQLEDFEGYSQLNNYKVDLFLSNPPYIARNDQRLEPSVLKYEPEMALFAEEEGLYFLKLWALKSLEYLNSEYGFALFEFGLGQENALQTFAKMNKMNSEIILDQYQHPRIWKILKN